MRNLKTWFFLTSFLILFASSLFCQTFNTADSFPKKSNKTKVKTANFIVDLIAEGRNGATIIAGNVTDRETKSPIPGISITEKGTVNGTTTNSDGEFTLNTQSKNAILLISYSGYNTEEISTPESTDPISEDDNSLTSLSGLFIANLGQESTIQPNIMLSQSWKIGRHSIDLRIMGLQNNMDTIQRINALNLIKPEISKINFRITGDFRPIKNNDNATANTEINIFKQQLNQNDNSNQNTQKNDISSLLFKFTAGYRPADGLNFYASGVYYNVFEGVQYYQERFGPNSIKHFWNFEISGKFQISDGALAGTFIQAMYNVNSKDFKKLLNTEDSGVFLIRLGFNKDIYKK